MTIHVIKLSFISLICVILSVCLGFGSLNHKQVKVLKKEGFVLTNEGWSLGLPERLLFEFDQYEVNDSHQTELKRLAGQLKKYNLDHLKIVGHTDNVGKEEYNQKLSEHRAQSVANLFLTEGFQATNIQVIGKGPAQPIANNDTEEGQAANRRVAVIIIP